MQDNPQVAIRIQRKLDEMVTPTQRAHLVHGLRDHTLRQRAAEILGLTHVVDHGRSQRQLLVAPPSLVHVSFEPRRLVSVEAHRNRALEGMAELRQRVEELELLLVRELELGSGHTTVSRHENLPLTAHHKEA